MATNPDVELAAMRRALVLAASPGVPRGPNPRVGAVILDARGEVVGEGHHRGAGTSHAEVDALEHAAERARGGTAVVTLEPCNHAGRTGPCSEALIAAGVRRVVVAQRDLTPRAQGGAARLREAGVEVDLGVLADASATLNPWWTLAQEQQRPYVTWKFAATLDGRSAAADGTSQWITGPAARRDVHRLRAECDAIVVGTGTVLADNPRLTARDEADVPLPSDRQPRRFVLGTRPLPSDARVFDRAADTVVVESHDLASTLEQIYESGCQHVWLEGGPTLAAAFVRAGFVDEVVAYVAPALLGSGTPAVPDLGIDTVADALRFRLADVERLGDDVRLILHTAADPTRTDQEERS